jgi:hypothetical protein
MGARTGGSGSEHGIAGGSKKMKLSSSFNKEEVKEKRELFT